MHIANRFAALAIAAVIALPLVAGAVRAEDGGPKPIGDGADSPATDAAKAATPAAQTSQTCPGHPDALGTSRVLAIDFGQYKRVGRMQYPTTLPLNDKEVVLTFDDGPLPPYSNQILDILSADCVKATFFMVGEMARAYPATVRRAYEEGHTIGTHSNHHPSGFQRLPVDRVDREIDGGIAGVAGALGGDPRYLAPFFRIPGLGRSEIVESEAAARGLIIFSSDTVADDWHRGIKPQQIIDLAIKRLEARGKGILLLHDIHPATVAALPGLLQQLKEHGFHIVQVVPSAAYEIAMAHRLTSPMVASAVPGHATAIGSGIDSRAPPSWPKTTDDLTSDDVSLPAPDVAAFEPDAGLATDEAAPQWPDGPQTFADLQPPEPTHAKKSERLERKGTSRMMRHQGERAKREQGRRTAEHAHLRAEHHGARARSKANPQRHSAGLVSGIKAMAALLSARSAL